MASPQAAAIDRPYDIFASALPPVPTWARTRSGTCADTGAIAGVEVKHDVPPRVRHVFQCAAGYAPEADDAVAKIAAWSRPRLGLAG